MNKNFLLVILAIACTSTLFGQRYLTPQFSTVKVTKNVKYGANLGYNSSFLSSEDLLMDVYEPDGDTVTNRPVIILVMPVRIYRSMHGETKINTVL
jgi:hypothetical protein